MRLNRPQIDAREVDKIGFFHSDAISVASFGVKGDGIADDGTGIQAALNSPCKTVIIPAGDYRVVKPLKIPSNKHIKADKDSRVFLCGDVSRFRGDFLLTNSDTVHGNENISISGGQWDGNNRGKYNKKAELFDSNGYSGAALNFVNVKNLRLSDLTVSNPAGYYIRMALLSDFVIRDIGFFSEERVGNQDGLHFCGGVKNGLVENISGLCPGQPNDDMIALNADDCFTRVENLDLAAGSIENVTIRNIFADDCHTFIRILSVDSPVKNIKIENIRGGYRCFAINMDAARYCRTPLFKEEERPQGAGNIENVSVSEAEIFCTSPGRNDAMILCESNVRDFSITNFRRTDANEETLGISTFAAKNLKNSVINCNGEETILSEKEDSFAFGGQIDSLKITAI